jgi:hypothetical protein
MGITVIWDNEEHTILRFIFEKHWTWEEVARVKIECDTALNSVSHTSVAIIYDAPPDVTLPPDMLSNARRLLSSNHPKANLLVFVLTNMLARMMINTLARISGSIGARMYVVDSVDEARQLIIKYNANIRGQA